MRCHYLSDLHLERQDFPWRLPGGDVLIIAGDLCHARALDPAQSDRYSIEQRGRVLRFVDAALKSHARVLMVAGNHEHYEGAFEDTAGLLRRHLPGMMVLDDEAVEIGGVRFFGTTLWTDFEGGSAAVMDGMRRRMGEYFLVRVRARAVEGERGARFRPEDALGAHRAALAAMQRALAEACGRPTVVISHHAPSLQGLNPRYRGNGLDGAYGSDLDALIAGAERVPHWVHGHTHIRRRYRVGATMVHANCRGFEGKDAGGFAPGAVFEM